MKLQFRDNETGELIESVEVPAPLAIAVSSDPIAMEIAKTQSEFWHVLFRLTCEMFERVESEGPEAIESPEAIVSQAVVATRGASAPNGVTIH